MRRRNTKSVQSGGLAIAAALLLAVAIHPAAAESYLATTTSAVNVRAGAGAGFSRLATLPAGTPVEVEFCRGDWCSVNIDGLAGWLSARYIAGDTGVLEYRVPAVRPPVIPPYVPPLVVPRGHYHDQGYSRQHKFQRRFE